jgi:hypothetical protein
LELKLFWSRKIIDVGVCGCGWLILRVGSARLAAAGSLSVIPDAQNFWFRTALQSFLWSNVQSLLVAEGKPNQRARSLYFRLFHCYSNIEDRDAYLLSGLYKTQHI